MKHILISFLLLISGLEGNAQKTTISGTVIDKNSRLPLIGVNIRSYSDMNQRAISDLNGLFEIELELRDSIVFSYLGFKELIIKMQDKGMRVLMTPIASRIDEIVVVGSRLISEEFSYEKLGQLDIYTTPSAKADPILAVNALPSTTTTTDETANISFRGSDPDETGIFINNVPIYDAVRFSQLNGVGTFSIFNTALVKKLLVFPGNPPLEYGNVASGLISIETVDNIPEASSHNITLSMASSGWSSSIPLSDRTGIQIFANVQYAPLLKATNEKAFEKIEAFSSKDIGLHFVSKVSDKSVLKVFNYTLLENYSFNYSHPTWSGPFDQNKKRNFTIASFVKNGKSSKISVNAGASFSKTGFGYSASDLDIRQTDLYFSTEYFKLVDNHSFKTGLSIDRRKQTFEGKFFQFTYAQDLDHPIENLALVQSYRLPEYYAYYKYYLSDKWLIAAGIRKNFPVDEVPSYISYQGNLKHQFTNEINLKLGFDTYHKRSFLSGSNESSSLVSSKQLSMDFTTKLREGELLISAFMKDNILGVQHTSIFGLEAYWKGNLSDNLKGQLSYTYVRGNREAQERKSPIKYDMAYFIKGGFTYQMTDFWSLSANVFLREGIPYNRLIDTELDESLGAYRPTYGMYNREDRLPTYKTVDLSLFRMFIIGESLSLMTFISGSNIFNFENVSAYNYNFDYSERSDNLLAQRVIYFGLIINL